MPGKSVTNVQYQNERIMNIRNLSIQQLILHRKGKQWFVKLKILSSDTQINIERDLKGDFETFIFEGEAEAW